MTQETIGFIGVGSQGGPMAHRIVDAGMPLVVWARRPEVLTAYTAKGAATAASAADLGARCNHVGICVVNDADVFSITDQLIPAMKAGGRIAIHSTVLPETVARLEAQCDARGLALIDAPVSGGSPAAEAGALTVMCGGRQEAFDAALPVFRTFGRLIVLLGPAGAGQRAKIVNNAMLSANMGVAMAAVEAAQALDIDHAAFIELIQASSGRSFGFDVFARLPSPAAFATGAPMLLKDINLLKAVLPGHVGAGELDAAAARFLAAANPGVS
ncbi:MAG: NAD(P)-dependent oxidoreductase [Novosphingobium sp.]|jgi:3-hydroxyisobutyrate dehydrogenase-like beta-hydroxyacid dehydrogenase|nr:NAD(P)-dependent oxidoreductase [Novosphingobium sp.]